MAISKITNTGIGTIDDITLSGGLYVGGTGSANYLDDYEEGTCTLTFGGSSSNPSTPVTITASYKKIGKIVYCEFRFANVNLTGASGGVRITGWPFTMSGGAAHGAYAAHTGFNYIAGIVDANLFFVSSTHLGIYGAQNAAGWTEVTINGTSGCYLYGSITYQTS